ncbi:TcpE family conjugal transfer membrane protein [Sphaerisporangium sp. NPDC005288]|uniref:TcpE family conjugal transfer membrane protein n=1 Tax=Sphaerisporangium sp. NPDC005288 TaxID=3155114 RepID=UPI0033BE2769
MDLPTYTNIWRIEKRLYKLYDLRLPMPLPIVWIGVFLGVLVPWSVLLRLLQVPMEMPWHVLYLVPPGIVTWLSTRPVIESKRLNELLQSQLRYFGEPKTWCRLAPADEPDEITFTAKVWRSAPQAALLASAETAKPASRSRRGARAKPKHTAPRKRAVPSWAPARQVPSIKARPGEVRPSVAAAAAAVTSLPAAEPPARQAERPRVTRGTAAAQPAAALPAIAPPVHDPATRATGPATPTPATPATGPATSPPGSGIGRATPAIGPATSAPGSAIGPATPVIGSATPVSGLTPAGSEAPAGPSRPRVSTPDRIVVRRDPAPDRLVVPRLPSPGRPAPERGLSRDRVTEAQGLSRDRALEAQGPSGGDRVAETQGPSGDRVAEGRGLSRERASERQGVSRDRAPEHQGLSRDPASERQGVSRDRAAVPPERSGAKAEATPAPGQGISATPPPIGTEALRRLRRLAASAESRGTTSIPGSTPASGIGRLGIPAGGIPVPGAPAPDPAATASPASPAGTTSTTSTSPTAGAARTASTPASAGAAPTTGTPSSAGAAPTAGTLPAAGTADTAPAAGTADTAPAAGTAGTAPAAGREGTAATAGTAGAPDASRVAGPAGVAGTAVTGRPGVEPSQGEPVAGTRAGAGETDVREQHRKGQPPRATAPQYRLPESRTVWPVSRTRPSETSPFETPASEPHPSRALTSERPSQSPASEPRYSEAPASAPGASQSPASEPRLSKAASQSPAFEPRPSEAASFAPRSSEAAGSRSEPAPRPSEGAGGRGAEGIGAEGVEAEAPRTAVPRVPARPAAREQAAPPLSIRAVPTGPGAPADPAAPSVPVPVPRPGDEPRVRRVESVVGRDQSGGWRRLAQVVVGGGGPNRNDGIEMDEARARTTLAGSRRVVVLGCTGGAGQTTTTLMLGHTLARYREDRVVAVDANTGDHTLTGRIATDSPETLTSLLAGLDGVSGYLSMRAYTTRCESGLEVVGSDSDAAAARRLADRGLFSDERLAHAMRVLDRHYRLIIVDPAASMAARMLAHADQLVLVAPASEDAPDAVAMTFDWLDGHGSTELRRRAVMVINGVSRRSMAGVEQAEAVARGRCRAIVRVPWEDELAPGHAGPVQLAHLRASGRRAYVALAGVVASGLAVANRPSEEEVAQ